MLAHCCKPVCIYCTEQALLRCDGVGLCDQHYFGSQPSDKNNNNDEWQNYGGREAATAAPSLLASHHPSLSARRGNKHRRSGSGKRQAAPGALEQPSVISHPSSPSPPPHGRTSSRLQLNSLFPSLRLVARRFHLFGRSRTATLPSPTVQHHYPLQVLGAWCSRACNSTAPALPSRSLCPGPCTPDRPLGRFERM